MPTLIFKYKKENVFVGSYWTGMKKWMKDNRVKVKVNCAVGKAYDVPKAKVLRVCMHKKGDDLDGQLKNGLTAALYMLTIGRSILVHSIGECRAGAFVVLLLGFVNMFEGAFETWEDAVHHAQATFATKRSLSAVRNSENQQVVKKLMEAISNPIRMLEEFRTEISKMRVAALDQALQCAKPKVGADPKARPQALPPQSMQSVQAEQSVQSVQSSPSQSFEVATLL